jgi:hypothetical protein
MTNLHLLNEVVQELEQDRNLTRIKKLMICVCQGTWENNADKIQALNLRDLVLEVCETTVTSQNLKSVLNGIVSKINKPQQYAIIANKIFQNVSKLYPEFQEEATEPDRTNNYYDAKTLVVSPSEENSNPTTDFQTEVGGLSQKPIPLDQIFDLRLKVMQHTSPLRAKLVIFSAIDRLFDFNSDEDWGQIKKISLDELLQNLCSVCKTAEDLESLLYHTAKQLPEPDEQIQAASVVIQHMSAFYREPEQETEVGEPPNGAVPNRGEIADEMYADRPPETVENWKLEALDNSGDIGTDETEVGDSLDEDNSEIFAEVSGSAPQVSERKNSDRASGKFSLSALSLHDPLKQKQELEEIVSDRVRGRVREVVSFIETQLNQLEIDLDEELNGQEIEEMLSLKYDALGDFVIQLKDTSSQFLELLSRLEEAERNRLIHGEKD